MRIVVLMITLLSVGIFHSQGPGGVGGVDLWFKADSQRDTQLNFTDYSSNKHTLYSPTNQNRPSYSYLNFNETLHFDGINNFIKTPYQLENLTQLNLFSVYQNKNMMNESALFSSENSGEKELYYSTANIYRYNNEQINFINPNKIDSTTSLSFYSKFDVPSKFIHSMVGSSSSSNLYVGKDLRGGSLPLFKGNIPEFFVYRKILTQNEYNRIKSYLAIKYGVTIPMTEYLSSKSVKIWKSDDYVGFFNNVAGIARDNFSGLYQKQAKSTSDGGRLIVAVGNLAENNKKNSSEFGDQTFLLWGDDAQPLELDKESFGYQLLKRKWKTRFYSETNSLLSTEVIFSTKNIVLGDTSNKNLWLLVDRKGSGNFNTTEVDAYTAYKIDDKGNAYFKGIRFDKDLSGTDVFSFALGSKLLSVHELTQPTCKNTTGNLNLSIKGGTAPFTVNLKRSNGSSQTIKVQSTEVSFANLSIDRYSAEIKDAHGFTTDFSFDVSDFIKLELDLGADRKIKTGEYVELDASKKIVDPTANYLWSSSNGFVSNQPKVKIYEPGEYTVKVKTAENCTKESKIIISRLLEKGIAIYPNPTKIGEQFTIRVDLENKGEVNVHIYDMTGRLIKSRKEIGNSHYEIKESISNQGTYIVVVDTVTDKKTFKLIIN